MIRPVLPPPLQDTLEALAEGEKMHEIAARFHVSTNSVKDRLQGLYRTLEARDRAHAVAIGFRVGVLNGHQPPPAHLLAEEVPLWQLTAARQAHGYTQRELAMKLGVSRVWLCHRETGRYLFTLSVLRQYADLVGVDLDLERGQRAA